MPEPTVPRALLHGASCSLLLFLLIPAVQRALGPLAFPLVAPTAALLVAVALALPALPLPPRSARFVAAVAGGSGAVAAALHSAPAIDLLALTAATLWLGLAPRHLSRRAVMAGMATGFAALPLAFALRPGRAGTLAFGTAVAVLALAAFAWPAPKPSAPERRARGFRLRGLLAFGALLHFDAVLRPLPTAESVAIALVAAAGLLAAIPLWIAPGPLPTRRRDLLILAALAPVATAAAHAGFAPVVSAAAGHALLVVLVGRALVPAGGRRPRIQASAAWLVWAAATAVAGSVGMLTSLGVAAVLALLALALLPRTAAWRELQPSS